MTPNHITERLKGCNYTKLGEGAFAAAYAKSDKSKWVIKTGPSTDGWLDYITMIMQLEFLGNPYVPKVRFLKINPERKFYVAVLERLAYTVNRASFMHGDERFTASSVSVVYNDAYNYLKFPTEDRGMEAREQLDAELIRLCDAIRERFTSRNLDFHSDNAMIKSNGQMVITDPVSSSGGSQRQVAAHMKTWCYTTHGVDHKALKSRSLMLADEVYN